MSASCPLCVRLGPARRVRFISPLRPVWLFLELVLFQFLKVEQRDVRARRAADQLVQLDLQGLRIAVLGILNEEYHEKGGNGGTGVDHELPCVRETDLGGRSPPTRQR